MRTVTYVGIALALVAFGYLALFSIGFPFALTGLLMLALIAWRRRPPVLVPALAWPWLFTLGYLVTGPVGCTSRSGAAPDAGAVGSTTCNAVFLTYAGGAAYRPPLFPAVAAGVVLATAACLGLRRALRRSARATADADAASGG